MKTDGEAKKEDGRKSPSFLAKILAPFKDKKAKPQAPKSPKKSKKEESEVCIQGIVLLR